MDTKCIIDPSRDCIGLEKATRLETRIEALEAGQRKSEAFRQAYYDEQRARIKRDAEMDAKINNMDEKLDRVLDWQEAQQAKPGKRWESIVDKSIWAVVAAVIAFFLARIGL